MGRLVCLSCTNKLDSRQDQHELSPRIDLLSAEGIGFLVTPYFMVHYRDLLWVYINLLALVTVAFDPGR